MDMPTAAVVIKTKSDKASIKSGFYQSMQIATMCAKNHVKIIDCLPVYGQKSIMRELKTVDARKRFDYVIFFSPAQVAKTKQEFDDLVNEIETTFKCEVRWLRTG